jgi:MSHA biogenesis protein MshI
VGLFSSAKSDAQVGVDFLPAGVAVAQVQTSIKASGQVLLSEFLPAIGQQAQVDALRDWVRTHNLQKMDCVCLIASGDYDVFQIEKPAVDDAELSQALTWRIKDLISYDVAAAVVEMYPMPASNKNNTQQLSVVAANEAVIRSYIDSIKSTGLKLQALDIYDLVSRNLAPIKQGTNKTQAILSLQDGSGLLSIFHDSDLYVSRDFKLGVSQMQQVTSEDQSAFDSLLLEIQRSMDYFESYYGLGSVSSLLVFPQLEITEKMALYLQNLTNFDIDFISSMGEGVDESMGNLDRFCFHAYCAAIRGSIA